MATAELTPPISNSDVSPATLAHTETPGQAERGALLTFETLAYVVLAIVTVVAHVWGLGDRALHHDETLHAFYSWLIYQGNGYIHDPLLHGPFLYYFGALLYFLFGDNDFTARLGPALFSILLTMSPWLIRRELGRVAAFAAAVYLLISPAFLYTGRFFRHDSYSILFEILVFIAVVRYASTRQARWLYVGAAAFGFMYVNQETSYLYVLMMFTPLVLLFLWRVFKPGIAVVGGLGVALALLVFVLPGEAIVDAGHAAERDPETNEMVVAEPGPIFGWGPLETEDNGYALRIRNRADGAGNQPLGLNLLGYLGDLWLFFRHPAILLGTGLLLASCATLIGAIWFWRQRDGRTPWQRATANDRDIFPVYASLAQGPRLWIALAILLAIYLTFFTAFFTNIIGSISGTTGSLLYWLAQHNVERGNQPPYYYLVLLVIYEPLAFCWALVGLALVIYALIKSLWRPADDASTHSWGPLLLPLLLVWWSITALGIYSWAGEKMPWLLVHSLLPQVLLGAWAFQRVVVGGLRSFPGENSGRALLLIGSLFVLIAGFGYIQMTRAIGIADQNLGGVSASLMPVLIATLILLLFVSAGLLWNWRWAIATTALALTLIGSLYTIRNAYRLSYQLGDVPREMLIYTQTSPDVMRVVRRLEEVSQLYTRGLELPIIYDNETVWQWYLRDFTNATRSGATLSGPPGPEIQAVFLLRENYNRVPAGYLDGFVIQEYPLRWWFPQATVYHLAPDWHTTENLDNATLLTRVLRSPLDDATVVETWNFLVHRDLPSPLGSTNFVIAVRPEIADLIGPGVGAESRRE